MKCVFEVVHVVLPKSIFVNTNKRVLKLMLIKVFHTDTL
jgi:hypothetical protein